MPPLALSGLLVLSSVLLVFNVVDWLEFMRRSPDATDFGLYWVAFAVGRSHGWTTIYDPTVYMPAVANALGRHVPYLNPPPLLWIFAPILVLPYRLALALWTALLAGCWVLSWRLSAPGHGVEKIVHLLAGLSVYIFFMGFRLGQVTIVVVAGLASCWWLTRHNHEVLAGVALGVLLLKPQFAFLVPATLLAAGYWRLLLGFLAVALPLLVLSLLALGRHGIDTFVQASQSAHAMVAANQISVLGATRSVVAMLLVALVAAGAALLLAWRSRRLGPELPIAAGIIASLLMSPYLNGFDLVALVLPAWLILRLWPPRWMVLLIVAAYLDVAFYVVAGTGLTLAFEAALLMALFALPGQKGEGVRQPDRFPAITPSGPVLEV